MSTPSTTPSGNRRLGRRVALTGLLAAAVIGGGASVAYATGGSSAMVEMGYATGVERVRGAEAATDADRDCPGRDGPGRDGWAGPRGGGSASPDSGETSPRARTTPQNPTTPETTPGGEL